MERHQPVTLSRRSLLSAALVGLMPKSPRRIEGGFVHESHTLGHQLRDAVAFPVPPEIRRTPVVIVGGGIAGLSAAWRLMRKGMDEFVVLEMEAMAGGNARWGENEITPYPWAAHYVPLPGRSADLLRELFRDLGVFDGNDWDERHLVHAPLERLFVHGRWQEGLEPAVGPLRRDREQFARFADRINEHRASGRFAIPSRADEAPMAEDAVSMSAWLDAGGFDSPWLRWMIDYACRDEYGALSSDVSAWAGLLYFAGRDDSDTGPLTWPEGNGWIVRRLLERIGRRVYTAQPAYRVERRGRGWRVLTPAVEWHADVVIVAAPLLVATRIVQGFSSVPVTYSPWLTANLTLDRWPRENGFGVAWDNVIFDSPSLGYVTATHQHLRRHVPQTVWTYYWALAQQPEREARQWLLRADWATLRDLILDDLTRAHPDIRECVTRVDIMRLGHAMVRPTPGLRSHPAWRTVREGQSRLFYAHSDGAGLPLFEEAQARGVHAADGAMKALGG
jgi:glycine/D-amino acid oxidase-like deaminating enzyme